MWRTALATTFVALTACSKPGLNPITAENQRPGTADWTLANPAAEREIEGYASRTSAAAGERIDLFVSTTDPALTLEFFRMGWYDGLGARRMGPAEELPGHVQPPPSVDPHTLLTACDWEVTRGLVIPSSWTAGVYLARLTARPSGKQSYIIFTVRDDSRRADLLFVSSVSTYQAYNTWGGANLYIRQGPAGQARKVSFDRPYGYRKPAWGGQPASLAGLGAGDFLTNDQSEDQTRPSGPAGWEYPMVRFLEREGYDVDYATSLDVHEDPARLLRYKGVLSVGHDEYWSREMRAGFTAARDGGVHLGFFSANTAYWQMRLEPSLHTGAPDRTQVVYKSARLDPVKGPLATVRFRDPEIGLPENGLIGVMYHASPAHGDIVVGKAQHWLFEGTGFAGGERLPGLLGYEVDRTFDNGHTPPGLEVIACSTFGGASGKACAAEERRSEMTLYTAASGARVLAVGSMQWTWGLDDFGAPALRQSALSEAAQQVTRNFLDSAVGE